MSPSTFGARNTHFKQIQISSNFICKTASDEIALLAQGHEIVYALLIFIGKTVFANSIARGFGVLILYYFLVWPMFIT